MEIARGIIILILWMVLFTSCRNEIKEKSVVQPPAVYVTDITSEPVSIPVQSGGILLSSEEMRLSFKTGGIVMQIMADEGEKVKKGDVLATLNLSEINAQVDLAKSGFDKAQRDYNRARNLYADSVATLEQMENAATALSVARSNLEIARFNQTHSKIIAPDNGIILKQFVKQNELVAPGYPLFLFGTSGRNWKVKTGISDRDIVKINNGDSAVVIMDVWAGVSFPAVVEQIGEMANPLTGTYDTELLLRDMGYRLATGFVVSVRIFPSEKESFMLVPVESVVEADGESGYVFSVDDSSRVSKIRVRVVTLVGDKVAIKSEGGQVRRIVSGGAAYLKDGESVRITK